MVPLAVDIETIHEPCHVAGARAARFNRLEGLIGARVMKKQLFTISHPTTYIPAHVGTRGALFIIEPNCRFHETRGNAR